MTSSNKTPTPNTEKHAFNADISQLMGLIINTFYSNKDVAIRELVSNASDALDKIRYVALTDPDVCSVDSLAIRIYIEKEKNCIVVEDNGIGMTHDDLINTLGTIAKSGTKAFMEKVQTSSDTDKNNNFIGQFGVGFYSAFLLADRVDVITKHYKCPDVKVWSSDAKDAFTIRDAVETDDFVDLKHGTKIYLYLKDGTNEYAQHSKIENIICKHSEFITYPIFIEVLEEKESTEEEEDKKESTNTVEEEAEKEKEGTGTEENESDGCRKWKQLNNQKPIWTRDPSVITDDEYTSFYKSISSNNDTPSAHKHFHVEGQLEFRSVLFIPSKAPFDMFQAKEETKNNIRLYVRRVFITDDCKDLIPEYLRFVCGVVDSEDLPLNVSREMLQQNNIMKVIRKHLVKKSIDMIEDLAKRDNDEYLKFYKSFSKYIKLGVHEDSKNRTKLIGLLRFQTSVSTDTLVSMDTVIERRKNTTDPIYYMTGEDISSVKSSPLLERVKQKGHEVIFMTDTIDEYVVQQFTEYKECKLISVSKEGIPLQLSEGEEKQLQESTKHFQPLCDTIKTILGTNIEKVILSNRIVSSPCCLVSGEYGWSANMERIMKAQALGDKSMMSIMGAKRTLELNPDHEIIKGLFAKLDIIYSEVSKTDTGDDDDDDTISIEDVDDEVADKESSSEKVGNVTPESVDIIRDVVWLLYDSCSIRSGFSVTDVSNFADRINQIVTKTL
jgi:molecular chaperone HtpG